MFDPHDPSRYEYFVDNRLCFGVSCAPAIFNRLSNAIVRMMAQRGFHLLLITWTISLSLAKQKLNVNKVY